jgi:uncharacterized protein (DUF736 family)
MAYEMQNGQGNLFKNLRKEKPNQPDYRGECVINGVKYLISGWIKQSKKGTKFFSLAIKDAASIEQNAKKSTTSDLTAEGSQDDIPF